MRKAISLALIFILTTLTLAAPLTQEPAQQQAPAATAELANKDVLDMLKSGLATEIVVAKIKSSPGNFDTSTATLAELKSANVPDAVILAMLGGASEMTTSSDQAPVAEVKVPDGTEIEILLK